jgi:hypothetical protein
MKERSRFTEKERSTLTITLSSNGLKSESPHPLEATVEAGSIPQIKAKPKTCNRLTMLSTALGTPHNSKRIGCFRKRYVRNFFPEQFRN